jgi:transposase InsO family protein
LAAPAPRPTPPRDPAWQQPPRRLEQSIRADVVALVAGLRGQGLSATAAADLFDLAPRTLRQWQHDFARGPCAPAPLGRPHVRAGAAQAEGVLGFLHGHGPWVGMPTLRGAFPAAPRAELHDLLAVFRHLWAAQHPRWQHVLHWHRAGTVWAMDFTHLRHPIDDVYPYVFAVRDLASGLQLAWQPVLTPTMTTVQRELELLFTIHGAPLVLKCDNGSAFRADGTKAHLARWRVWPLYSPPGVPGYNGAIEASIGSLKTRTAYEAYRRGRAGAWTSADLDAARDRANTVARPRGARAPTPAEAWASRRPPTGADRDAFTALAQRLEEAIRHADRIAPEVALDHYEQAALHRRVLTSALVESGLLTIARRRIPQRFYGQKMANIR